MLCPLGVSDGLQPLSELVYHHDLGGPFGQGLDQPLRRRGLAGAQVLVEAGGLKQLSDLLAAVVLAGPGAGHADEIDVRAGVEPLDGVSLAKHGRCGGEYVHQRQFRLWARGACHADVADGVAE